MSCQARTKGTAHGGIGAIARLVGATGLAGEIDGSLELLKLHKPYYESDHVLNIAYNALCGGQRLQDIEARRCDAVFLDGLGIESLPDPTTAGDFCRRFDRRRGARPPGGRQPRAAEGVALPAGLVLSGAGGDRR